MKISKERLENKSEKTGFRPEILEKVIHLMGLLNDFSSDPFLSKRIALKGGTALNLFCYDCPRLSVDIDINYIGSEDRSIMLRERDELIQRIENICLDKDYYSLRKPSEHAGGKLKALFSRHSSRDLFDTYYLLQDQSLDLEQLRIAFVVYGGMSRVDWRTIKIENIHYEWVEFKNMLLPMLKNKDIDGFGDGKKWANTVLKTVQKKLSQLLPFRDNELAFLDQLLNLGNIKPELLTEDAALRNSIIQQPGLLWKAIHVKKHITK